MPYWAEKTAFSRNTYSCAFGLYYTPNATVTFTSEALMDKYIGFDIDDKKTVACIIEKAKKNVTRN